MEARAKIDDWHRAAAAEGRATTNTMPAAAAVAPSLNLEHFAKLSERVLDLQRRNIELGRRLAAADARVAADAAEAKVASARILDLEAKLLKSVGGAAAVVTDDAAHGDFDGG